MPMRSPWKLALLAGALLAGPLLCGCNAPPVTRDAETTRFRAEMQQRLNQLELDPGVPLTMERCEEVA